MTERLFQFIWQFQYFNKTDLLTTTGEAIQVLFTGNHNNNQGPDFNDARIKIGETTWAGSVELHIRASDWDKHNHQQDRNYNNVILHVVWEDDAPPSKQIPVLELKNRVAKILLQRYEALMKSSAFIPCENSIQTVRDITWSLWKERLLAERLLRKSNLAGTFLEQTQQHWEETFWWMLARNFGMKLNADALEQMARSIPLQVLAKHKYQLHQLEALLMGQAGLLEDHFEEDYPKMLQKEYRFLKNKYQLNTIHTPLHFLRTRPGNFPTIRLAQLAMLVQHSVHLFSRIKEAVSLKEVRSWFDITANDYWHYHYRFDELSSFRKKKTGSAMIDNIIINTVVPILFAYGEYHNEAAYKEKAIDWLQELAPEINSITKGFQQLGIKNKNAGDSQALIELKNEYCSFKRCLECAVGNALLKNS